MSKCEICGKEFKNERGVAIHSTHVHGESNSGFTYECTYCGGEVERSQKWDENVFCDRSCFSKYLSETRKGANHPNSNGEEIECEWCGEEYYVPQYRVEKSRFCSRECKDKSLTKNTQEDHPRWKGGHPRHYSGKWHQKRKERLEIDDYVCVVCGRGKQELGREPSVHHIQPVRTFDDEQDAHRVDNLVTLCRKHHSEWEGLYLKPDIR